MELVQSSSEMSWVPEARAQVTSGVGLRVSTLKYSIQFVGFLTAESLNPVTTSPEPYRERSVLTTYWSEST